MKGELKSHDCIIFYDSACPQCSWFIRRLKLGSSKTKVVSLMSDEAKEYYERGEITINPDDTDTMVVMDKGEQLLRWQAIMSCIKYSNLPSWLKKLFSIVPNVVGTQIYKVMSILRSLTRRNSNVCKLPRS